MLAIIACLVSVTNGALKPCAAVSYVKCALILGSCNMSVYVFQMKM